MYTIQQLLALAMGVPGRHASMYNGAGRRLCGCTSRPPGCVLRAACAAMCCTPGC